MRKLWLAAMAACLLSSPAAADDKAWNRTGFYLGAVAGWNAADLEAGGFHLGETSLIGGAFAGFQARVGDSLVLGLEGDYLLADLKAVSGNGLLTVTAKTSYLASIRARAGVPIGPALIYATVGPAFSEPSVAAAAPAGIGSDKDFQVGLVVGGGMEASLTKTLFVRLEGLHYVFPDKDVSAGPTLLESQNQQTTVRIGIGFRLN